MRRGKSARERAWTVWECENSYRRRDESKTPWNRVYILNVVEKDQTCSDCNSPDAVDIVLIWNTFSINWIILHYQTTTDAVSSPGRKIGFWNNIISNFLLVRLSNCFIYMKVNSQTQWDGLSMWISFQCIICSNLATQHWVTSRQQFTCANCYFSDILSAHLLLTIGACGVVLS